MDRNAFKSAKALSVSVGVACGRVGVDFGRSIGSALDLRDKDEEVIWSEEGRCWCVALVGVWVGVELLDEGLEVGLDPNRVRVREERNDGRREEG